MQKKFNQVAVAYAHQCPTCKRMVEGYCPWCYYELLVKQSGKPKGAKP